jgi:hypothetical protein
MIAMALKPIAGIYSDFNSIYLSSLSLFTLSSLSHLCLSLSLSLSRDGQQPRLFNGGLYAEL